MRYMPIMPPNAVQTGVFARAIVGQNWKTVGSQGSPLYGPSWMTLPILDSPQRQKTMAKAKTNQPDYWPTIYDYTISSAAEKLRQALSPPKRISNSTVARTMTGIKPTDLVRACEIAGYIQKMIEVEHFVVLFQAQSEKFYDDDGSYLGSEATGITFEGIVPVAGPPDDFGAAIHAMEKAEQQFYDLPMEELSFIWDDLVWGTMLDPRDRARLTGPAPSAPLVLSVNYTPYKPEEMKIVQPEPSKAVCTVVDKATGEETPLERDPKLDDAFARMAATMNIPHRPIV